MVATAMADPRPGPRPRGVYMVQQGRWKADVVRTFHAVPWLDGASVRITWRELEPRDGEFDWSGFDAVLAEVKKWNAAHPDQRQRTLQIRPMAGSHCPRWLEGAGAKFYRTKMEALGTNQRELHIPVPYDNPEFLKQLRELYRVMLQRYADEPLVVLYHGTWSAGPWDEIFHPMGDAPLPPGYTKEKFVAGMVEQLDVLIDEICLKGKPAELPFSGIYPPKSRIDITGPIVKRIVERLGEKSDLLYIQSNGWGITSRGVYTPSWGHEADIDGARGRVLLAFQAIGTNAGGGWIRQGDWRECIRIAKEYEAQYLEIYPPSLSPMDEANNIEPAMHDYREWLHAGSAETGVK